MDNGDDDFISVNAESEHEVDSSPEIDYEFFKNESNQQAPKTKERTVGYIIEKVANWRRLYNGYYDSNFKHHRMSLEDAATKVGVSKKSLDDYLAQLRAGRERGYDFNLNKD